MDVVSITQPAKLLLSSSVPAVEADLAAVGGEVQGPDLDTDCGCKDTQDGMSEKQAAQQGGVCRVTVLCSEPLAAATSLTFILLLELSCEVALHKGGLACSQENRG